MNLIVLVYILSNLFQSSKWETKSSNKISGHENIEFQVGDLIETNMNENMSIKIQTVGNISLSPSTKVKITNCETDKNELTLYSGILDLDTRTFFNRLNILINNYLIKDFGSQSSIKFIPEHDVQFVETTKGELHIETNNTIIPVPEGYIYRFGEIASYPKESSKEFISNINNLKLPISRTKTLSKILTSSTKKEIITLWILLQNANFSTKEVIYSKIAENIKIPSTIKKEKILNNNKEQLQLLLEEIEWQI